MVIYIGADHRGFELKESLKKYLIEGAYEVEDIAPNFSDGDDYPDIAKAVAVKVSRNLEQSMGIIICASGSGVDIVANKFKRIRSVLGISPDQVFDARHDDNVNVLSLAADFTDPGIARNMVKIFLETKFDEKEERFRRRLAKLLEIERENMGPDQF